MVWAKAADVLRGHPQLKPELERLMPQGLVGKWMRGVVKSSVARTVARKAIWQVHFAGLALPYDMERGRFQTTAPRCHPAAIFSGVDRSTASPPCPDPRGCLLWVGERPGGLVPEVRSQE